MNLRPNIERLKNRKRELRWTNNKLSEESGIPVGTLNKIFNGTTRYPRDKTIDALVQAMGLENYEMEVFDPVPSVIRETGTYNTGKSGELATLATYYSLPDELRAELIDGKLYYLPAPKLTHQVIVMTLSVELYRYLEGVKGDCRVYASGCDVRLDRDDYTMVKPDIFVVRGKDRIVQGAYCMGAPEFIIEVAASSDSKHDFELKRYKYQNAGVKEYWIVDPVKRRIVVYVFGRDAIPTVYSFEEIVRPYLYPDLQIDFGKVKRRLV